MPTVPVRWVLPSTLTKLSARLLLGRSRLSSIIEATTYRDVTDATSTKRALLKLAPLWSLRSQSAHRGVRFFIVLSPDTMPGQTDLHTHKSIPITDFRYLAPFFLAVHLTGQDANVAVLDRALPL